MNTKASRNINTTQKSSATRGREIRTLLLMAAMEAKEIGARIAQARNEAGLTQAELADLAPFSTRSLQNYEAGESVPYAHMRFFSEVLKRPVPWFLHGETEQPEGQNERLERMEQMIEEVLRRLPPAEVPR